MNQKYLIEEFEKNSGYKFKNEQLLINALSHTSYANELMINKHESYERLEFLGDAVLELVSSEYIFKKFPDMQEGNMTKKRASYVCEPTLAICARDLKLDQLILLGQGEERCGGRGRDSILCDVMEATIGAVYLDGGFEESKKYIFKHVLEGIENKALFYDCKTNLQEMVQKHHNSTLEYRLVSMEGPDHEKVFRIAVYVDDKFLAEGVGSSKKKAEQNAAYTALKLMLEKQ